MSSNWLKERAAGILLHPTALPGPTGIGTFGEKAYRWVDFLAQSGAKFWQVLPLGVTGYSPYQSTSSFAGNPYLIDLPFLVSEGLLVAENLKPFEGLGDTKVDFAAQYALRTPVLRTAYDNFKKRGDWRVYGDFEAFCENNKKWLLPYALYTTLKGLNSERAWNTWPEAVRDYKSAMKLFEDGTLDTMLKEMIAGEEGEAADEKPFSDIVRSYEFYQYLFLGQWQRLKGYANGKGIKIIGDIPIYVLYDSADVWSNRELFDLDSEMKPVFEAGCPPDYFDTNGQHWGNPLYKWDVHKNTDYQWWIARLSYVLDLCDVVRIDHFRAFFDYWMIPHGAKTAKEGHWGQGPKMDFFDKLFEKIPNASLIAEDLGDLNDGVRQFVLDTGLPGMTVLQFSFGGDARNLYLPHNAHRNQVAYSGTHDNDTLAGWIESAKDHERGHALRYLNCHKGVFVEAAVKATFANVARLAVVPAQDLLGLGASARFNVPGVADGNWSWRMSEAEFERLDSKRLREMLEMYARV